jgi:PAS domain S-box-containing protein
MVDSTKIGAFVQSSPHPAWLATSRGHCTYANPALERLTGLKSDQIVREAWQNLLVEEDRAAATNSWQRSVASGTPYRTRVRVRGFDGSPATVELIALGHPVDGASQLWLFTALYIHSAAQQYPPLEAQLQATLNLIPAYTWYASASGGLTFLCERGCEYLGLPPDHPLRFGIDMGNVWDSHIPLLHPDDHEETRRVWSTCLRTGSAGEVSFRIRNAEGDYRWFLSRTEPLRADDGTLLYWIGVNLDIDDAKRAEEALNAAKEQLARASQIATGAQLSASIAHEIVQPLSALVANARAALNWLSGDDPNISQAKALIEIVLHDGMSIGNVVHEIRRLFKGQSPNKTTVQVNELIGQVLLVSGRELREKNIALSLQLDPTLPTIEADGVQIQQVLLNLIKNAMEAFPTGSVDHRYVQIRTSANHQDALVEVEDNGRGFADAEKIFEAFFTSKNEGFGIGLAISRSIAETHGGTLVAANRNSGGACFSLRLPFRSVANGPVESV